MNIIMKIIALLKKIFKTEKRESKMEDKDIRLMISKLKDKKIIRRNIL